MTVVTRRTVLRGLVATGVGVATGTSAYGVHARDHLVMTRESIGVSGLPTALGGLRIGLLTDIHRSRWVSREDVTSAVTMLMAERPDLIILGGDYVTLADRQYVGPSADALAPLSAPNGVFAILGNHDDDRDMPAALEKNGVQVLKDARTHLTINGHGVDLAGIRYWTRRPADIAAVARGATAPIILLAHDPRRLIAAAALDIPPVLSGHTRRPGRCSGSAPSRRRSFRSSPASAGSGGPRCS